MRDKEHDEIMKMQHIENFQNNPNFQNEERMRMEQFRNDLYFKQQQQNQFSQQWIKVLFF